MFLESALIPMRGAPEKAHGPEEVVLGGDTWAAVRTEGIRKHMRVRRKDETLRKPPNGEDEYQ